jgi:molybdopterin biosynthesis enzyme MoaB
MLVVSRSIASFGTYGSAVIASVVSSCGASVIFENGGRMVGDSRGDVRVEVVRATFFKGLPDFASIFSRSILSNGGAMGLSTPLMAVSSDPRLGVSSRNGTGLAVGDNGRGGLGGEL